MSERSDDSNSRGAPTPELPHNALKFSIYNILQPDFGIVKSTRIAAAADAVAAASTSPSQSLLSPPFDDQLPAWVYCTRYSDRPSAGPRCRKTKRKEHSDDEKRPRTAFTPEQLERLKLQFNNNRYLTEKRRQELAHELGLNESQIKIWFQNKRAKLKKAANQRPNIALQLMELYGRVGALPLSS